MKPPNKALHWTAIPLRSIAASELTVRIQKIMSRVVKSKFQSFTHTLDKGPFEIFKVEGMYLDVSEIEENSFVFEVSDQMEPDLSDDEFAKKSHEITNLFTISINVCTLGLFLVQENRYISPRYQLVNIEKSYTISGQISHDIHEEDLSGQSITSGQVNESLLLYGALAKEENKELISEYLKGLIHLSLNYAGTHFEKDAFANFYRTFEHIVTKRLLGKEKLKNEIKEINTALSDIGMGEELLEEFKKLYIIRGSQAMHSQLAPGRVSREDTMKMKVFTDTVLYRCFKPIWEAGIK